MTVIRPNSIAGINSITVQSGQALNVHDASGNLIRSLTNESGISTFSGINIGTAATIFANGNATFSGIVTATTIKGVGALTSLDVSGGLGIAESLFHLDDTNTRIAFPANDTITAETGGSERVRILSGGNVGLGTTNPTSLLHMYGAAPRITLTDTAGSDDFAKIFSTSGALYLQQRDGTAHGEIIFRTENNSTASERLRISNVGALGIAGANYGTSGQVLTSGGSGAAPSWSSTFGSSNITFSSDVLQVSSTTQGLGAKYINTGNEYTNLQFSAARTAAGNALGIINAKWNNNHEVAAIYLQAGDDTTNKDDGKITFYTAAAGGSISSRLEILNDGDVKVSDGDLVIGTSGHGIDFSATGDAGGMTSELLDNYEEGTFTPVLNNGGSFSSTAHTGTYTRVGRLVHFIIQISGTCSGTGSGTFYISGLPFTADNSTGGHGQAGCMGALYRWNIPDTAYQIGIRVSDNSTNIQLFANFDNSNDSQLTSPFNAGTIFGSLAGSYFTAS